jgi:hypothetical protein
MIIEKLKQEKVEKLSKNIEEKKKANEPKSFPSQPKTGETK